MKILHGGAHGHSAPDSISFKLVRLARICQSALLVIYVVCRWIEDLTAFGDSADDVFELDVVGIVGLDVSCEAVEGALDGFFGGRVHHAWLSLYQYAV
jgi:hypothetical protein